MTFDFRRLLIFALAAVVYSLLRSGAARRWVLFAGSVVALYWLQPPLPPRFAGFLLPTATLVLTAWVWWLVQQAPVEPAGPDGAPPNRLTMADRRALLALLLLVLGLSLFRYVDAPYRLTAARPPPPPGLFGGLAMAGLVVAATGWLAARRRPGAWYGAGIALLALLFVILKYEPLTTAVSSRWRLWTAQDPALAAPADLAWLGYSYVAFRLIHVLRERQLARLPPLSLQGFVAYAIFFPAVIAGPIHRMERFAADWGALPRLNGLDPVRWAEGAGRLARGLFLKFVLADALALGLALDPVRATQVTGPAGLWLLLYGYGLRLYLDFAGYTDMAIGLGLWFGIRLPENFDRPYWQRNLTAFWQRWHMSLSDWVRFYVFTPLSRWLLKREPRPSPTLIVLAAQLTTMAIIGLWHGVTVNFLIWGLWHGLGLFVHKQWSDRSRRWYRGLQTRPVARRLWALVGWSLTFHYVTLGWVWFLLPGPELAARTLGRLVGLGWAG